MPRNNSDDIPQSELELLEQAMAMMQGPISLLFRSLTQGTDFPSHSQPNDAAVDHFGGHDFRQLASKSRRNRGIPEETQSSVQNDAPRQPPNPPFVHSETPDRYPPFDPSPMLNLLQFVIGGSEIIGRALFPGNDQQDPQHPQRSLQDIFAEENPYRDNTITDHKNTPVDHDDNSIVSSHPGRNWTFSSSSTSQRRILRPDGTEETVYTETQNGVTKTMKRIKYPDGTVEETQEQGKDSILKRLAFGDQDQSGESFQDSPLSRMLNRFFGR